MTRALRIPVVIDLCANRPDQAMSANAKMAHTDQTANVSKLTLVNLRSLLIITILRTYHFFYVTLHVF